MILIIDNYDSFVYNIALYLKELNEDILVARNDKINIEEIKKLNPEMIFLSPGPFSPQKCGICLDILDNFKGVLPIFGICLGHQIIAHYFSCKVGKASRPQHGKVHQITHANKGVFKNLKNPLNVTRYHSLIVQNISKELEITAKTNKDEIMGIRHKTYLIEGVQFHPEAILSECGHEILENFIKNARKGKNA